jgi:putative cardiolipin synthase
MRFFAAVALTLTALFAGGCRTIDRHQERPVSAAVAPAVDGVIARTAGSATASLEGGHSAFHLLEQPREALDWRLALTDHATRSIDIQYYLWNTDATGLLLLSRLLDAADRGVRVRLLVDDFLFENEEERLAALCHHRNVEIRIFNPQFTRSDGIASKLEVLLRFGELNRRMHNKAFIVDNRLAVMGGRNIGDEYFGLGKAFNFLDLDVLTAGPVVAEASSSFDRYWNSPLAFPGEAFSPATGLEALAPVAEGIRRYVREERDLLPRSPYPKKRRDWSAEFASLRGRWHSGTAILIDDAPTPEEESLFGGRLIDQAFSRIGSPSGEELLFASPYLIPGREIHRIIRDYTGNGVEVRLLTASLAANNHLIVHSHYRRHRRALLDDGARLHELRADAGDPVRSLSDVAPVRSDRVCLHVKAGVGDRSRCFIGSLNLDPRSIDLNTENGLLIESPGLGAELANHLETLMAPDHSWEVTMDPQRRLNWHSRGEDTRRQPAPDRKSRVLDFFLGLMPVEGLL